MSNKVRLFFSETLHSIGTTVIVEVFLWAGLFMVFLLVWTLSGVFF